MGNCSFWSGFIVWSLAVWTNASTEGWRTGIGSPSLIWDLTGLTVSANGTLVLAHRDAVSPVPASSLIGQTNVGLSFNGNDSVILYNGPVDVANIVDVISFTETGNEGQNRSFVRISDGSGFDLNPGSNVTDFPSVWLEVALASVDGAVSGENGHLGSYDPPVTEPVSITVGHPGAMEAGTTRTIGWSSSGIDAGSSLRVEYGESATGPWTLIAASTPNDGSLDWNISIELEGTYFVRVSSATASAEGISPSFIIAGSDVDEDGLTYGEEIALGTNPNQNDSDFDGFSDGEEVAAGTDPNDAGSYPVIGDFPIFFSQYYEGSGFNKYVELANPGGEPASLTGYQLVLYTNANTESWKAPGGFQTAIFNLSALTIPANGTLVLGHPDASSPIPAASLTGQTGFAINFSGNDTLVLYQGDIAVANIVDVLSFTEVGNEGANRSFVRVSSSQGYGLTAGSNITDFPEAWEEVSLEAVDLSGEGDNAYLGSFDFPTGETVGPLIVSFQYLADRCSLSFATTSGQSYRIETSGNLKNWIPVSGQTGITGTGGTVTRDTLYHASLPPVNGERFFRVVEE